MATSETPSLTNATAPSLVSSQEPFGASRREREAQREAFIKSITRTDVCDLASTHNAMQACCEFREPEYGGFNVCFFVVFPSNDEKWVVRFPIEPALHDVRGKLQSEVATMKLVPCLASIHQPANLAVTDMSSTIRPFPFQLLLPTVPAASWIPTILPADLTLYSNTSVADP